MRIRKASVVATSVVVLLLWGVSGLRAQQAPVQQEGVQVTVKLANEEVQDAVYYALRNDPFTFPYLIAVKATDGKVELRGKVDTELAKVRLDRVAAEVEGVTAVDNRVTIDPNLFEKTDLQIKEAVEKELTWSPLVPARQICVQVADGVVTLHGEVKDLCAVQSATANAIQGGAKKVVNKLTIKPHVNINLPSPWMSLRARPAPKPY